MYENNEFFQVKLQIVKLTRVDSLCKRTWICVYISLMQEFLYVCIINLGSDSMLMKVPENCVQM